MVLVTRAGCHLCDVVRPVLGQVVAETGLTWSEVSLNEHPELESRYGEMVPVILIDGAVHDYWRLDPVRLRAALRQRT
ncbi:MAG: glutaredoxin family protein [Tetrasphaera sp.]